MTSVWISAQNGILLRSNSIALMQNTPDGLYAGTITGQQIKITESQCPYPCQLGLLEEIRRAEIEDRYTILLVKEEGTDGSKWKRIYADFELK
jgi:hypothetical protein